MRHPLPLLLLAGCSSASYMRSSPGFELSASTVEIGERVSLAIPKALEAVRVIPNAEIPEVLHFTVETAKPGWSRGVSYPRGIDLEIDPGLALFGWAGVDLLVTHEVVHSCVPWSWHRLPAIVEEGVADVIAQGVEPGLRSKVAPRTPPRLDYTREEWPRLPDAERTNATAFGVVLVRAIGLERLGALVERSRGPIPIEDVLALADGAVAAREAARP